MIKLFALASALALAFSGLALAATDTSTLTVQVQIEATCEISDGTLDFGTAAGAITTAVQGFTSLNVQCTGPAAYLISADLGLNASSAQRRMKHVSSASFIDYDLYRDAARTIPLTSTPGTATGSSGTANIYGTIPAGQGTVVGLYNDNVTITLTF